VQSKPARPRLRGHASMVQEGNPLQKKRKYN